MSTTTKLNFDLNGVETVYELNLIRRLFLKLEEQLVEVQKQAAEDVRKEYHVESEEVYQELRSMLTSYETHAETETQALRSAEIVRLYILFEEQLTSFCKAVSNANKLDIGLNDLNGKRGLTGKARLYLCQYAKLISNGHVIWKKLDTLRIIRNHLVHGVNSSSHNDSFKKLEKINRENPSFKLIEYGELNLTRGLCDHLHDVVREFFVIGFDSLGWKAFKE